MTVPATASSPATGQPTSDVGLTIAVAQDRFGPGDVDANLERIAALLGRAADADADLLVLPELTTSGYFTEPAITELAEPADGPTVLRVRELAADAGVALCFGYPELGVDGKVYNSAMVVDRRGQVLVNRRKTHLWANEAARFTPADTVVSLTEIDGFPIAVLICYEVEFPEMVRAAALAGADLVIVPTAVTDIGTGMGLVDLVAGRATENNLFLAYVNHSGLIDGDTALGGTTIAAPLCRREFTAGSDPAFHVARLQRSELLRARETLPYLRDRRPDLYDGVRS
jgi:predicted amidohydrolase